MLSRNNWLPFAAVLVVAALFYAVVEARLSTLVVLDLLIQVVQRRIVRIRLSRGGPPGAGDPEAGE